MLNYIIIITAAVVWSVFWLKNLQVYVESQMWVKHTSTWWQLSATERVFIITLFKLLKGCSPVPIVAKDLHSTESASLLHIFNATAIFQSGFNSFFTSTFNISHNDDNKKIFFKNSLEILTNLFYKWLKMKNKNITVILKHVHFRHTDRLLHPVSSVKSFYNLTGVQWLTLLVPIFNHLARCARTCLYTSELYQAKETFVQPISTKATTL